jgi:hypothetical protein
LSLDPELQKMRSLNERDFTLNYVMPYFSELGYSNVVYTGGNEEHGRDVTFHDFDRCGNMENMAAQVKIDDIAGNSVIRTVINEAISAYQNPFIDTRTHQEKTIYKLYVVTSGRITDYAKQEIRNGLRGYPNVQFVDGETLLNTRRGAISRYIEYSRVEVLMRERGIDRLLTDSGFLDEAERILELLFNEKGATECEGVNDLPKLLLALPSVRDRVNGLDSPVRDSLLHWLSIKLVIKAWYLYGRSKVFGLKEES